MMGSSGHIAFNLNTISQVDRVVILRINTEEMQIETLLNERTENAIQLMGSPSASGKVSISLSKLVCTIKNNQSFILRHAIPAHI
jgi:hypothetical protein